MIRYILLGLSCSVSLALVSIGNLSPVRSQTNNNTEIEARPSSSSERDTFSSGLGNGLNPFDLMHQMNLNNNLSREEYLRRQQRQLNSEASEFRQKQKQLLRQDNENSQQQSPTLERE